ncbi:carboxypeptidase regulatory-like domain-containing protein [Candidatus Shapirobacteria bacterium]|nr:carboxypeptidase regulatory-like domain-containing protein [Candidatus Shapirobacteria bacterium]
MEQHAIPQQITSYEFKLVGEMTLKQFGKAAGGIIIALIINASPLVFFIKWPLIFIFAVGGLAMAFVPFQDRPLDVWLRAFIKSIYSPTIYIYQKKAQSNWLDIDLTKQIDSDKEDKVKEELPVKESHKVQEFIESLPSIEREDQVIMSSKDDTDLVEKTETKNQVIMSQPDIGDTDLVEKTVEETVEEETVAPANLDLKRERLEATGKAVFGEIPMPDLPEQPNLVVGMVTDSNGKIIEGAIVEIQDKEGNPSRVLKTNQLGQFKTSTQLAVGEYLVVTEKEGFNFDRVEVNLNNDIVKPIKIIAK